MILLQDKMFGCIAGCHIASSMGAVVEGMSWQEIEEQYGYVETLYPYEHYWNGWQREAGTTEDGVERQKLIITAIGEKKDRVNAEDIRAIWLRDIKGKVGGWISEPFEETLLAMAKTGIPAADLGRYCDYAGLNSFARACHPIGLINAGDVLSAKEDVLQCGQLYQTANSKGLKWACVTGVAIAEAAKPHATVDRVIGAIYDNCDKDLVVQEIDKQLDYTKDCTTIQELRERFDSVYNGQGMPYPFSYANEVVTKGICILRMVQGNTKEAILAGVNMGRDTDCVAAVAAGIAGALTGAESIPEEWIKQVDYATSINPYTNSKRTLKEHADLIYYAFRSRLDHMEQYARQMNY
ncbi:MAG: hypothetical protein HFG70_07295 [Hungatella sp.]|nr:hypothetical protein [Hungatella sp.]